MGCNICRAAELELKIPYNEIGDIKEIKEVVLDEKDYQENKNHNNFMSLLEENLLNIGKIISQEQFDSVKPQNYTNTFLADKSSYINNIQKFDVGPIQFHDGGMYKGSWNSKANIEGEGEYYIKNDNIFIHGIWNDGDLKYARLYFINGEIYEGEVRNFMFNGKGILISKEEKYEGEFKNNEKEGKGRLTYEDGVIYEGNFVNGEFKGKGVMTWNNEYQYEGEFKGANLSGMGKLRGPGGEIYEGQFENNLFDGHGKYTFGNGNIYEGEFKYGYKSGQGKLNVKNKYIFEGYWDNDLPNGNGTITTYDKSGVLKSIWRSGNIIAEPIYENGNKSNFMGIDLNIIPNDIKLYPTKLTHLDNNEIIDTQYKPRETFPSYLND